MSCDITYPDVRTLCSAANADARGGLSATVCIVLRIKTAILSRLRGNILQRGRLRWSRPDRQAGTCHLVEVAGNRTSKNEKWQDIDLLIAAVQTHRCEGQEEGCVVVGAAVIRPSPTDREIRKKSGNKREIAWLPPPNVCSTLFMCLKVIGAT